MLSICPNNKILVANDNKQNLLFFNIEKKDEIKLTKTLNLKFKIGSYCFNYTG